MYDISDHEASYIYAVSSAVGIVASIVISALLDKFKKFKLFMIILVILGLIFQALFTLLLELSVENEKLHKFAIGMTLYTLVTAVLIPFYTIGMNYACEITYPVGESINGGIMMSMSQISGIVGTFGCDALMIDYEEKKWASNILLLCFFVVASVFVFLFDERLARNEVDQAGLEKKALPEGEAANVEQEQQQAENEQPQASEP
jgi:FLVCR family feline leukemia virus subgroup C receptor-related protein